MHIKKKIRREIHIAIAAIIMAAGAAGIVYSAYAYPKVFGITASLESQKEIAPRDAVRIKFSEPMLPNQAIRAIEITPAAEVNYHWQDGNKTLFVAPVSYWKPEQTYYVSISKAKSLMLTEVSADLAFDAVKYPKVREFYPAPGEKDVMLDIEDPMKAVFDKPIGDFNIKFAIKPFQDLAYQLDPESREVKLLSKSELRRGQRYEIEIWAKHKDENDSSYRKIFAAFFETKPLPPDNWEKDFNLRLDQARKLTEPKIKEGKYIDLNLKSQVMTIFENGKLLDAYLISSGKRGMPTPQGTFRIANKTPRAWSKKYGLYMPYWNAIVPSGDFGIHELPEWPGGFKEGQAHLGTPVSHGCVRLGVGPAEIVYNWTEIGTPVIIHE